MSDTRPINTRDGLIMSNDFAYTERLQRELAASKKRIAELEAACEKAEYELDWHSDELRKLEAEAQLFNSTFDAQQMIIEELRAENQRLRNAIETCERCRPYAYGAGTCKKTLDDIAALLGGGEK